jgi:hypothetical protein
MSFTDWISAAADLVMAGSAVSGVCYARRWYNQVVSDEGTKLSLKFVEYVLPEIRLSLDKIPNNTLQMKTIAGACLKNEYKEHKETFDYLIDGINTNLNKFKSNRFELIQCLASLERRGFNATDSKRKYINNIAANCISIEPLLMEAYDLISLIRLQSGITSSMYEAMRFNIFSTGRHDNQTLYDMLVIRTDVLLVQYNECLNSYDKFMEGEPHIKSYFQIKK